MPGKPPAAESPELFYKSVFDEADLLAALRIEGIDEEVAALRIELRRIAGANPKDVELLLKATTLVVRAVAQRYRMSPQSKRAFAEAAATVVEQLAGQLFPDRMESEV